MLTVLKIRNLALVDDLTWEVGPGLVGVTGETGAGKSVIVGALKLILGERADRGVIRTGQTQCVVEAGFQIAKAGPINHFLEESGLDACEDEQLIVRRAITRTGQNKQFINNSPSTLATLKGLGELLVDLHGPHDHQSLLSVDRQLAMLDEFAGAAALALDYRAAFHDWRSAVAETESFSQSARATEQEIDLLRYQIDEIETADPKADEEGEIEKRYRVSSNSTRLLENANAILGILAGGDDGGVVSQLADAQRMIRDIEKTDPAISDITGGFDSAQVELEELERSLRDYASKLELDPAETAALEERINTLETLKRKYGNTIEEVLEFRDAAATKLEGIVSRDDRIDELRADVEKKRKQVDKLGAQLSAKRKKAAPKLTKDIASQLADLGFKRSTFEIPLDREEDPTAHGFENVDFQFSPNPGEPAKALRIIASSGEMSRLMLAVKSALAEQDGIPLMVFDEIDANVGGEIARAVGAKMSSLGEKHQVIAITHFPQVAAMASCHYVVTKEFQSKRTFSLLREVNGDDRVAELTRMLGGDSDSARALAENLLLKSEA